MTMEGVNIENLSISCPTKLAAQDSHQLERGGTAHLDN